MNILGKFKSVVPLTAAFALAASVPPLPPKPDPIQIYRSLLSHIPPVVDALTKERPTLKHELTASYNALRQTCPALNKIDARNKWNVEDWLNKKITPQEWQAAPYSFRMNSYRVAAVQGNTATKTELLGKLYDVLPSSPLFKVWVDDGMESFNKKLYADPVIQKERRNWDKVKVSDKRLKLYSERIGSLMYYAFLPGEKPDFSVEIKRSPSGFRGQFTEDDQTVRYNFSHDSGRIRDFTTFERTAVHEYFHTIETKIMVLAAIGKFRSDDPFYEMGEKFYYTRKKALGYVPDDVSYKTYKNTFNERWSYYVMDAADKPSSLRLATRAADWAKNNPVNPGGSRIDNGIIPQACVIK